MLPIMKNMKKALRRQRMNNIRKVRDLNSALNVLYTDMREVRVTPNVVTHNTLVHTCMQLGKWERGWQLVREMQEKGGVSPDCATCTSLISSIKQMKEGEWRRQR
mmetsp:Transcript_147007/g.254592  ORF Transcript_147007/g.254592 Transcript_147007/m.254592 type:complete len:105 (+) Transcript_147007:153-467(+)